MSKNLEKKIEKLQILRNLKLYEKKSPRSKKKLHQEAAKLLALHYQNLLGPQPEMAEIMKLASELRDADPLFRALNQQTYPVDFKGHADPARDFIQWAVGEGLARATQVPKLEKLYRDVLMPIDDVSASAYSGCLLLVPRWEKKILGEEYFLFDDYASAYVKYYPIPSRLFTEDQISWLYGDYAQKPLCVCPMNAASISEFIITDELVIPKTMELTICESIGGNVWHVADSELLFYEFHATDQDQMDELSQARTDGGHFTAYGFGYNPQSDYWEAQYLEARC